MTAKLPSKVEVVFKGFHQKYDSFSAMEHRETQEGLPARCVEGQGLRGLVLEWESDPKP